LQELPSATRAVGPPAGNRNAAARSTHLLFLLLEVVNALSCHSVDSQLCRQGCHHLCQAGGLLGLLLLLMIGLLLLHVLWGLLGLLLLLEGCAAAWHACARHGGAGAIGRPGVGDGG
jgi:hypothetical protein